MNANLQQNNVHFLCNAFPNLKHITIVTYDVVPRYTPLIQFQYIEGTQFIELDYGEGNVMIPVFRCQINAETFIYIVRNIKFEGHIVLWHDEDNNVRMAVIMQYLSVMKAVKKNTVFLENYYGEYT